MSPETLQVREWRSVLSDEIFRKQIVVVAVDEVHCILYVFDRGQDFKVI